MLNSSDWIIKVLNSSGYKADYSLDSLKEIDRFFDVKNTPTGILSKDWGQRLFDLGAYVGQTAIKLYGREWITDDNDPDGEIRVAVKLANGSTILPIWDVWKDMNLECKKVYMHIWQ